MKFLVRGAHLALAGSVPRGRLSGPPLSCVMALLLDASNNHGGSQDSIMDENDRRAREEAKEVIQKILRVAELP